MLAPLLHLKTLLALFGNILSLFELCIISFDGIFSIECSRQTFYSSLHHLLLTVLGDERGCIRAIVSLMLHVVVNYFIRKTLFSDLQT